MTWMFRNTWAMMLSVASQRMVDPYGALTAGPNSHSPVPTAVPASSRPGLSSTSQFRTSIRGAAGNFPRFQGPGSFPGNLVGLFLALLPQV
jgi:hypothetical protein